MPDHTVDQPAAEREPDHVTPSGWTTHGHAIPGIPQDLARRPDLVARCGGPAICQECADESEPDGLTAAQVEDDRIATGLDDADDFFVIGQTSAGWAEKPTPETLHFRTFAVALTACGIDANEVDVRCTEFRTEVTCSHCAGNLVDEQLVEPTPERRTVSLEVATDELRDLAVRLARSDIREEMAAAKVVLVLRFDGDARAVPDTDVPWSVGTPGQPVKALRGLLSEMIRGKNQLEREEGIAVELLMPTPDVLAALDGRPDATFWTAPVPVTARHVEEGWLVVGYSGPGMEERVEAKREDCGEADCPWPGDCTPLTIGDDKPQHFADWSSLTVRIPASVTR